MAEVEFMALLRGIGMAIKEAQQAIETFSVAQYAAYFDEQKEGNERVLHPKSVTIAVPQGNGPDKKIKVPLVAITRHHTLMLDKVKVRLMVSTHMDEENGAMRVEVGSAKKKKKKGDAEQADQVLQEIQLVFKRDDPPEGIARLTQDASKNL